MFSLSRGTTPVVIDARASVKVPVAVSDGSRSGPVVIDARDARNRSPEGTASRPVVDQTSRTEGFHAEEDVTRERSAARSVLEEKYGLQEVPALRGSPSSERRQGPAANEPQPVSARPWQGNAQKRSEEPLRGSPGLQAVEPVIRKFPMRPEPSSESTNQPEAVHRHDAAASVTAAASHASALRPTAAGDQLVLEDLETDTTGVIDGDQLASPSMAGAPTIRRVWQTPTAKIGSSLQAIDDLSSVPVVVPSPLTGFGERSGETNRRQRLVASQYRSLEPSFSSLPTASAPQQRPSAEASLGHSLMLPSMMADPEPRGWTLSGRGKRRLTPSSAAENLEFNSHEPPLDTRTYLRDADRGEPVPRVADRTDSKLAPEPSGGRVRLQRFPGEVPAPEPIRQIAQSNDSDDGEPGAAIDSQSRAHQELKQQVFAHSADIHAVFRQFDAGFVSLADFVAYLRAIFGENLSPRVLSVVSEPGGVSFTKLLGALCVSPSEALESPEYRERPDELAASMRDRSLMSAPELAQIFTGESIPDPVEKLARDHKPSTVNSPGLESISAWVNGDSAYSKSHGPQAPAAIIEQPSTFMQSLQELPPDERSARVQLLRAAVRAFMACEDGNPTLESRPGLVSVSAIASGADSASAFRVNLQDLGVPITAKVEQLVQRHSVSGSVTFRELMGAVEEATKARVLYDVGDGVAIAGATRTPGAIVRNFSSTSAGHDRRQTSDRLGASLQPIASPEAPTTPQRGNPNKNSHSVSLVWDETHAAAPFERHQVDVQMLATERPDLHASLQRSMANTESHVEFDDTLAGAAGVGLRDDEAAERDCDRRQFESTRNLVEFQNGVTREELESEYFSHARKGGTEAGKSFAQSQGSTSVVGQYAADKKLRLSKQLVAVDADVSGKRYERTLAGSLRPAAPFGTYDNQVENPHFYNLAPSLAKRHGPFGRLVTPREEY